MAKHLIRKLVQKSGYIEQLTVSMNRVVMNFEAADCFRFPKITYLQLSFSADVYRTTPRSTMVDRSGRWHVLWKTDYKQPKRAQKQWTEEQKCYTPSDCRLPDALSWLAEVVGVAVVGDKRLVVDRRCSISVFGVRSSSAKPQ